MYPTFSDGDVLLVAEGVYSDSPPCPGDVVLAKHPFKSGVRIVKRVSHLTDEGHVFVVGDNRLESSDSRGFGALPRALILGRILGPLDGPS